MTVTQKNNPDTDYSNNIISIENAIRGHRDNLQIEARENEAEGGGINWDVIGTTTVVGGALVGLAYKDQLVEGSNKVYKSAVQASRYLHSSYKMPYDVQMKIYQDKTVKEFFKTIMPLEEKLKSIAPGTDAYNSPGGAKRYKALLGRIASKKTGIIDYLLGKNIKYTPKVEVPFAEQISGRSPIQGLNISPKDLARMFSTKELQKWNLFKVKDMFYNKLPNKVKHTLMTGVKSKAGSILGGFFQYRVGQGITDAMGIDSVTGKGFFREAAVDVGVTSGVMWSLKKIVGSPAGRKILGKLLIKIGTAGMARFGSSLMVGTTGIGAPVAIAMAVAGGVLTIKDIYNIFSHPELKKIIEE